MWSILCGKLLTLYKRCGILYSRKEKTGKQNAKVPLSQETEPEDAPKRSYGAANRSKTFEGTGIQNLSGKVGESDGECNRTAFTDSPQRLVCSDTLRCT